ncbi:TauD/TfdA family dioxygenase [Streptomyces sp. NPDC089799]|uniref:TauD/TfdA family dioxygenase n=1 Tax=Streptomyces sp. NPDC089799 TaxID=3155066 RepID=UPI00342405AE
MFIDLPGELEEALIDLGGTLPAWELEGSFLAGSTMKQYRAALEAVPGYEETIAALRGRLTATSGGYAVVRLGGLATALGTGEPFLKLATAFAAEVAVPFSPFEQWPLWKTMGTRIGGDPGLSSGTGYNAFHMDLVNASRPPDYTSLLCLRPDPLGGGPSIVSDARAAVGRLSKETRALLSEDAYRYGTFYGFSDVGAEYKPFPVLDGEAADAGFVRFTAKMLGREQLGQEHARAAEELAEQLVWGQVSFTLQAGDFLVIDQHRCVHGREALGDGQETVPEEERRMLLQLFLRAADAR